MIKSDIEKLLSVADQVARKNGLVKDGVVQNKESLSAIVGFGATVVNIGLKSTLLLYLKKEDKEVRYNVAKSLFDIAKVDREEKSLVEFVRNLEYNKVTELRKKLVNASVALKLIMRTYETPKTK